MADGSTHLLRRKLKRAAKALEAVARSLETSQEKLAEGRRRIVSEPEVYEYGRKA